MFKCKNANRYQGLRKPSCNGGNPCTVCITKYLVETLRAK